MPRPFLPGLGTRSTSPAMILSHRHSVAFVVLRAQSVPHHVIGYRLPQHVAAYARYSEVNPAEYACVRNLSYRIGEARERPRRPGRIIGRYRERRVIAEASSSSTSAAEPLTVECPEGYSG